MRQRLEGAIALVFLAGMAILFALTFVVSRQFTTTEQTARQANHSRAVLIALQGLSRALLTAESSQRGFLLTSDPDMLRSFVSGAAAARPSLSQVAVELNETPEQRLQAGQLQALATAKLDDLERTVNLHAAHRTPEALAIVREGSGKRLMERIQNVGGIVIAAERKQQGLQDADAQAARAATERLFRNAQIGMGLFSCVAFLFIRRELKARSKMTRALRASEARLTESERHLRAITDNVPAIISQFDRDHRCLFINEHVRKVFGMDPAAMLGKTQRELRSNEDFIQIEEKLDAVLRGETSHFELQTRLSGHERHVQGTLIPHVDATGVVQGYYSLSIDITERKLADLNHQAIEKRLKAITGNIPALVAYIDSSQIFRFLNSQYGVVFNVNSDDYIGRHMRDLLGDKGYAAISARIEAALRGERQSFERDAKVYGFDSFLQTEYIPDIDQHGNVCGVYILIIDITKVKLATLQLAVKEHQLRTIADNLPVLLAYIDKEETISFLNSKYQTWLGIDTASAIGRKVAEILGPEAYALRQPSLQKALAGERTEFQLRMQMLDADRDMHVAYLPDCQADGAVVGLFALSTDVTAMKQVERQLYDLARIDTLTGMPNRRHFDERLQEALLHKRREPGSIAVMFLDIDQFKSINDTHGHAIGDAVLCEFGSRLKACVRATDVVARLAGDEFVVLLNGLYAQKEASHVARKIVDAIQAGFTLADQTLKVTTSLGVAYASHGEVTADTLLAAADKALYSAKHAGRNGFRVVSCNVISMREKVQRRA